jgi:hypothetical protein
MTGQVHATQFQQQAKKQFKMLIVLYAWASAGGALAPPLKIQKRGCLLDNEKN